MILFTALYAFKIVITIAELVLYRHLILTPSIYFAANFMKASIATTAWMLGIIGPLFREAYKQPFARLFDAFFAPILAIVVYWFFE